MKPKVDKVPCYACWRLIAKEPTVIDHYYYDRTAKKYFQCEASCMPWNEFLDNCIVNLHTLRDP